MYRKIGIAAMTLVGLATAAQANTTRFFPAADCGAHTPADDPFLGRFAEGCFNLGIGTTINPATGECSPSVIPILPILGNLSSTVDLESLTVGYTNSSNVQRISCQATVLTTAGTVFASASLDSALASNLTTPATGSLVFTGANLPNNGNSITGVRTQLIGCSVPSRTVNVSGTGCALAATSSAVVDYAVETVNP